MLNPSQLEALVAVARDGSIAGAAARLGYTPSAVSQQIAALERRTGLRLLDRGPRSAALTSQAQGLLPSARAALEALSAVEADAARIGGLSAPLVLAAFPSALASLVPSVLAAAAASLSGEAVRVEEREPQDALAALRSGEADVVLGYDFHDRPLDVRGLRRMEVGADPFRLYMSSQHPLARSPRASLAAAARHPWVADGPAGAAECFAIRHLAARGLRPRVAARSNDTLTVMRLVAEGVGLALLPQLQGTLVDGATSVDLEDAPPPRRIFAAAAAADQTPRAARREWLLRQVRSSAAVALTARAG